MRFREKFNYKVKDEMWDFYKEIGVIDSNGRPTEHFGDPMWVYYKYLQRKGDKRRFEEVREEASSKIDQIRKRGVALAMGHGREIWDLDPTLDGELHRVQEEAKKSIWTNLSE